MGACAPGDPMQRHGMSAGGAASRAFTGTTRDERIARAALILMVIALGVYSWASDFVSFKGARTVYTAECQGGTWQGPRCTGRLVAGERYRFQALKTQGEVLFWTFGSGEPSGKLPRCSVTSGRNWSCPAADPQVPTITLEMVHGEPVIDGRRGTRTVHALSKLRWMLLSAGLPAGNAADN